MIWTYIKSSGLVYFNLTVWFHLIFAGAQVGTNLWLSEWTNAQPVNGSVPISEAQNWIVGFAGFIFFQGNFFQKSFNLQVKLILLSAGKNAIAFVLQDS